MHVMITHFVSFCVLFLFCVRLVILLLFFSVFLLQFINLSFLWGKGLIGHICDIIDFCKHKHKQHNRHSKNRPVKEMLQCEFHIVFLVSNTCNPAASTNQINTT